MPVGPGKYDHEATRLREATDARGAIVIVVGGSLGSGFSVQADLETTLALPGILEQLARGIRDGLEQGNP